ncbi:MAG TPA: primosomal protein N' [Pirellulaceae bacterium]|nr:primosomal protein N' [Pirellulaceae bacterium]
MSKQGQLFDTTPPPWILDDQPNRVVARVVFAQAPYGPYDFLVPDELQEKLREGMRVIVPFGRSNRKLEGYCLRIIRSDAFAQESIPFHRLKPILKTIDRDALVPGSLLALAAWISQHWLCPLGKTIETIIPAGVRSKANLRDVAMVGLSQEFISGRLQAKLSPLHQRIVNLLQQRGSMLISDLTKAVQCTAGPVSTLQKHGVLIATTRTIEKDDFAIPAEEAAQLVVLNAEQQSAFDTIFAAIHQAEFQPILLHGITGSGKTEIYIRAIEEVIKFGRQAIVLVPEISLTPQTRRRFRARFERVAVLHSNLTGPQRAWHWRQIAQGNVQVVVGARSAIFAPLPKLGLVVIDEEHDASFKQDKSPRYHARDVAVWRAQHEKIPLVLGSATPALESWQAAQQGRFSYLHLGQRVLDRPLPPVKIVDLRLQKMTAGTRASAISRPLNSAIQQALDNGSQVILLLNRRGYSTYVQCVTCGHVEACDECAIPLTHHRDKELVMCHYCEFNKPTPLSCPSCHGPAIRFSGIGTQKLEQEVKARFPDAKVTRMDTDTMLRPGSHEAALASFHEGETHILLGTQMIAKGLDFPNVTLVGVINADTSLHLQDFRAAERTFTMVTQVAGRSGRGPKGGEVIVQTFCPDHPAIVAAANHDYISFAPKELENRTDFHYPPAGQLARVVVRGDQQALVEAFAQSLAVRARSLATQDEVKIVGPAPAPLGKLRGKFRYHFLAQAAQYEPLYRVMERLYAEQEKHEELQVVIDMDPYDMM